MEETYGSEIAAWLLDEMEKLEQEVNDSCIDNQRFAECSNSEQMKRFRDLEANGCCGSIDKVVTHFPEGREFIIGLNYGH